MSILRVSNQKPCLVCGRAKGCGISEDGTLGFCVRVAEGAIRMARNGAWVHRLRHAEPRTAPYHRLTMSVPRAGRRDLPELARRYATAVNPARLFRHAQALGLTVQSLMRLRIGWAFDLGAWAFPMHDADGRVLGIRLRLETGRKFSVTGGREGLFVPADLPAAERLLIAEGPTDTAALLDLGFAAAGRPSATGGMRLLVDLVHKRQPREVVIVADVDAHGAGLRGAEALAAVLLPYTAALRLITPPAGIKDARDWKRRGAAASDVLKAIEAAQVRHIGKVVACGL